MSKYIPKMLRLSIKLTATIDDIIAEISGKKALYAKSQAYICPMIEQVRRLERELMSSDYCDIKPASIIGQISASQGVMMTDTTINCPFKQYCQRPLCRNTCPDFTEIDYLLERNFLLGNKNIYSFSDKMLQNASECLTAAEKCYKVVTTTDTSEVASCLTYAAICNYYKGNTYHCSVYHLNFADYVNDIQRSWTDGMTDELEYTNIFIEKCKVLIISNLDFIQFKDFQAQTLLNMAHSRKLHGQSTIIVSPKLNSLFGSGAFFTRLKEVFGKELIKL